MVLEASSLRLVSLDGSQGVGRAVLPPDTLRENSSCCFQLLVTASIPWLVTASLQFLPLSLCFLLLSVCQISLCCPVRRTRMNVLRVCSENPSTSRSLS